MLVIEGMEIKANKTRVLTKLKENLEIHKKIVAEAKEGYKKEIERELLKHLAAVREGSMQAIRIAHAPPDDYSKIYETTITALEFHTESTMTLTSTQVRTLLMDDWDWKNKFIQKMSAYSRTAQSTQGSF